MDTELGRCLVGTLNPDSNVRIKAELRLSELLSHPGMWLKIWSCESNVITRRGVCTGLRFCLPGCGHSHAPDEHYRFIPMIAT